jgi:hypothetical protein
MDDPMSVCETNYTETADASRTPYDPHAIDGSVPSLKLLCYVAFLEKTIKDAAKTLKISQLMTYLRHLQIDRMDTQQLRYIDEIEQIAAKTFRYRCKDIEEHLRHPSNWIVASIGSYTLRPLHGCCSHTAQTIADAKRRVPPTENDEDRKAYEYIETRSAIRQYQSYRLKNDMLPARNEYHNACFAICARCFEHIDSVEWFNKAKLYGCMVSMLKHLTIESSWPEELMSMTLEATRANASFCCDICKKANL